MLLCQLLHTINIISKPINVNISPSCRSDRVMKILSIKLVLLSYQGSYCMTKYFFLSSVSRPLRRCLSDFCHDETNNHLIISSWYYNKLFRINLMLSLQFFSIVLFFAHLIWSRNPIGTLGLPPWLSRINDFWMISHYFH